MNLSEEQIGGGTPSTSVEEYWNGIIPWIQSSDVKNMELFNVIPEKHISDEAIKSSAAKIINKNSISIVTRVGVGKVAYIPFVFSTSQDFLSLQNLLIEPIFGTYSIFRLMQSLSHQTQGTSIKGVTNDQLLNSIVNIPTTQNEQKFVGMLLQSIDKIITLEQEKLEKLDKTARFLLRTIFSKNNNKMRQYKLGEFVSKKGKINKEDNQFIVSSVNNIKGFVNQEEQFENTRLNNLDKSTYRIVESRDFAYNPSRVNVGSIAYNDTNTNLIVSPLYVVFNLNDGVNNKYFDYYTKTEKFLYEVSRNTEGSVRQSLSFENLGFINIPLPESYEEQLFIVEFFERIESIIFITEDKIKKYMTIKEYLLDNLFI